MELHQAKALARDVTCGLAPPLLGQDKKQTSSGASIRRQLRKGCRHSFTATYLKAKLRPISSFTFERNNMPIYANLNNVMAYDTVTSLHIRHDFQKRRVSFALDALGEPSFWRECPFILWHINIFNKHHSIHGILYANHNADQKPSPASSEWAAG